jgi:dienelactone hydrolase
VAVAFYPSAWRQVSQLSWKPAVPLTILIGQNGDWTSPGDSVRLGERIRAEGLALDVITYPGAYHGFDAPDVPVHTRAGINASNRRATVGTNPAARQDALARVLGILRMALELPA